MWWLGMCATCHCLVIDAPTPLPQMGTDEADTLEFTANDMQKNRRLTCQLEVTLGTNVEKVDCNAKSVHCSDGVVFDYDPLGLATGTCARTLSIPDANLAGVHTLRTAADARTMRDALPSMKRVVVIVGGFIGLEAAAMLSARGIQVDVVGIYLGVQRAKSLQQKLQATSHLWGGNRRNANPRRRASLSLLLSR